MPFIREYVREQIFGISLDDPRLPGSKPGKVGFDAVAWLLIGQRGDSEELFKIDGNFVLGKIKATDKESAIKSFEERKEFAKKEVLKRIKEKKKSFGRELNPVVGIVLIGLANRLTFMSRMADIKQLREFISKEFGKQVLPVFAVTNKGKQITDPKKIRNIILDEGFRT